MTYGDFKDLSRRRAADKIRENEKIHDARKKKLETDYNNNEVVQNLIRQNTDMKEQIAELEDRHRQNNL